MWTLDKRGCIVKSCEGPLEGDQDPRETGAGTGYETQTLSRDHSPSKPAFSALFQSSSVDHNGVAKSAATHESLGADHGAKHSSTKPKFRSVNSAARCLGAKLSRAIRAGHIDALVCISCDPDGVARSTLLAAARMGIPAVGTGLVLPSNIACHFTTNSIQLLS